MKTILYSSLACGLALALAACGDDGGAANQIDAPAGGATFTLTTDAFTDGGTFATDNTCKGANTSPAFTWTNAPSNAQSFAMVLTDETRTFIHWVLYDIPPTTTSLPEHVENTFQPANITGAKQTISINPGVTGFYGPCPPVVDDAHDYHFTVYALDVATLPGGAEQTTREDALAAIGQHKIASAVFDGKYKSPN